MTPLHRLGIDPKWATGVHHRYDKMLVDNGSLARCGYVQGRTDRATYLWGGTDYWVDVCKMYPGRFCTDCYHLYTLEVLSELDI